MIVASQNAVETFKIAVAIDYVTLTHAIKFDITVMSLVLYV